MKALPYIIISILLGVLLLQRTACSSIEGTTETRIDTLYDTTYIHDTVKGDVKIVKIKGDTVWQSIPQYLPDTSYEGLLSQYRSLRDSFFSIKTYSTKFLVDSFGYVIVEDSITTNSLVGSKMISHLKIPEKTITVEKLRPQASQTYVGGGIMVPFGAQVGVMHKDKKDRIVSLSVGANKFGMNSAVSYYVKIK